MTREQLRKYSKVHSDESIDVACIKIDDALMSLYKHLDMHPKLIPPGPLTNLNLPSEQPIRIEAASDIIVCSYPHGFYDNFNKFPIIKSGIIASSWGASFNGNPIFLIDAKLFPGSSGGLVLSKPSEYAVVNGHLAMHKSGDKQFVLLGIYSGEYFYSNKEPDGKMTKEFYGLGIVWYSTIIPIIIKEGVSLFPNINRE